MTKEIILNSRDFSNLISQDRINNELNLSIHIHKAKTITIIYPGANGSKDGYENKYIKMAELLVQNNIGAVIRSPNKYMIGNGWTTSLEIVIQYALEHAVEICGRQNPEIYLVGHSAGAGAIDLVCSAYEQVKKVLLTSPAPIKRNNKAIHEIGEFTGEVYIRIPENDIIPREEGIQFYDLAKKASKRDLKIVPNCDHEWSGEVNLKNFIELPTKLFA